MLPPSRADLPMSASEVTALAAGGVFDFGGHTTTHPVLPDLPPAERRNDISQGRDACERLIGRPITGFAYPHGALDDDSEVAVGEQASLGRESSRLIGVRRKRRKWPYVTAGAVVVVLIRRPVAAPIAGD